MIYYNNPKNYNLSVEKRKSLHKQLNKLGIHSCKESEWWPFYEYIPNLTIDIWESDIIKSDKFLYDCERKIGNILKVMNEIEL